MNTRGYVLAVGAMVALLFAVGCGSSSDSEVTVQTGSLSKAEFIKKADAICEAARSEFATKYTNFVQTHSSELNNAKKEDALFNEVVESIISPNFEGEIKQISELGAPGSYEPEVSSFLNTLQKQLDEAHEDPAGLKGSRYPFQEAADAAKKAGMQGCAESFG